MTAAGLTLSSLFSACGDGPNTGTDEDLADRVEVRIPDGETARGIADALDEAGLVRFPRAFALYARLRGSAGSLKAGLYRFPARANWADILGMLERGEVVTFPVTIPEGFNLREIAPRVAAMAGVPADSVLTLTRDSAFAARLGVPGPTLEGYLFPDTYHFAEKTPPERILETMTDRYRSFWGPAELARRDSLGLTERELVTLASIVEKEARVAEERPVIAGVYLNRLEIGMLLQADPTVQFALDSVRARLLYRDIEQVAENPYNTYTHAGLPPGPIASPGEAALRATLEPADVPFLFFVARPNGSHEFTRTEREHINAKNRIRRERDAAERGAGD
ncbi:MAG: endolytic transglycosylase MltG [Gemmatimonadota bacterium]